MASANIKTIAMPKSIIETSRVLPSIDEQINYVKTLRSNIAKHFATGLDMIFAIEQSLLAAKLNFITNPATPNLTDETNIDSERVDVLQRRKIKPTLIRIHVLNAIFNSRDGVFTISSVVNQIIQHKSVSRASIIKTLLLMKSKGLIEEATLPIAPGYRKNGRPEKKFRYINPGG